MKQTSMNTNSIKKGERGQIIPILALSMTLLLGLNALVVDFGLVYFSQNELNASKQARL